MDKRKKKLMEIQKEIHDLRLLILKLEEKTRERDDNFIKILKDLSKLAKTDLVKNLKEEKNKFYSKGLHWTVEESIQWLLLWFDKISEDIK